LVFENEGAIAILSILHLISDRPNRNYSSFRGMLLAGKMPTPQDFHDNDLYLIATKSAVIFNSY
jgi:hypothetical protein